MLDDKFRLCAAEMAARDRVYAYLANCPEIMEVINEPSFSKTAEMMKDIRNCSLTKIFCVVAVREIWQQTYPDQESPVGTWESIDKTRMLASSDVRVQSTQTAMAMFEHHDYNVVDIRIECQKYLDNLEDHLDNPVAWAIGELLPLIVERMCMLTESSDTQEERVAQAEKFCTEFDNDKEFNPSADDFRDSVTDLCESFRKKIQELNEDRKEDDNG